MNRTMSILAGCSLCCLAVIILATTSTSAYAKEHSHKGNSNPVCICHNPTGDDPQTMCLNEHEAAERIRHGDTLGECPAPTPCGGNTGHTCGTGQYCKRDSGQCSANDEGVCRLKPTSCSSSVSLVCGCDGTTYDNACRAAKAGVTVSETGACQAATACGGSAGGTCASDQYCKRDSGQCSANAQGVCTPKPTSCSTTLSQVCGCDGTTYNNACRAAEDGVNVSHTGVCDLGAACGGSNGIACATGQYCKRVSGNCAADDQGVCTPILTSCPPTVSQVCGCDGTTYDNACFADASGVTVSATGACVLGSACGGTSGGTCSSPAFCNPLQGDCSTILAGNCMTPPLSTSCASGFYPVCGCNGVTYNNACLAAAAGVGVLNTGPCAGDLACGAGGPTCSSGNFCKRPDGACGDVAGICTPIPASCAPDFDPVCGCNGTTYSSACVADAAGVTVRSDGPCEPALACGGGSALVCPAGQFCEAPTGTCSSGAAGTCSDMPADCPTTVNPVCGCNGTTYNNACLAEAAGVSISGTGSCP